jgi:uncharacterized radical SAM protein YgiQ
MSKRPQPEFLPITCEETQRLGISQYDIILVTGDAYLDHPASATALLGRTLWNEGFSVGVIPQPDIKDPTDLQRLGEPRLFFSVSAGSMDSMVAHYTPALKRRREDAYSPGGIPTRPDRATLVYSDLIHRLFPGVPIIIGGVEASLRRFAHYDYWSDKIRHSILADAPASLLVYGMGEQQLTAIAGRIAAGENCSEIRTVAGTCWKISPKEWRNQDYTTQQEILEIPSFSRMQESPQAFAEGHHLIAREQDPWSGRTILQKHPKTYIIQNPPALPLSSEDLDRTYDLPYQRRAHPAYQKPIPALESIRFSITSHRGCYGNCSFCALGMHQGTIIQSRTPGSILQEVQRIDAMPEFRGTISDIGGPSANMYGDWCKRWGREGICKDKECITCKNHHSGISAYLTLLDDAASQEGVKHVFIGSGLRYDLLPDDETIFRRLSSHVSGQVKVAPEHISPAVTSLMNKPGRNVFDAFRERFEVIQKGRKTRQFIIPYLMSGHPGCTIRDMIQLAEYLRDNHLYTEQVQDFTPTPMTTSTCMYATGMDPRAMRPVHIPKGEEKRIQRAILSWRDSEGYDLICKGLKQAGREDLIGTSQACLISRTRPKMRAVSGASQTQKSREQEKSNDYRSRNR